MCQFLLLPNSLTVSLVMSLLLFLTMLIAASLCFDEQRCVGFINLYQLLDSLLFVFCFIDFLSCSFFSFASVLPS